MKNNFVNKQITVKSIEQISKYLELIKEDYIQKFKIAANKNKNLPYDKRNEEYESAYVSVSYNIVFLDGIDITNNNHEWFMENLNDTKNIKYIYINFNTWYTNCLNKTEDGKINSKIKINVVLSNNNLTINFDTKNLQDSGIKILNNIKNIVESNNEKYDNIIKNKNFIIFSITTSIGIILSYFLYLILILNINLISDVFKTYFFNKHFILIFQWIIAIILGNIFFYWYIIDIYQPLLPNKKYLGYNSSSKSHEYVDDIKNFVSNLEVHIGKYHDALERRMKIQSLYIKTKCIIFSQILITILLWLI